MEYIVWANLGSNMDCYQVGTHLIFPIDVEELLENLTLKELQTLINIETQ